MECHAVHDPLGQLHFSCQALGLVGIPRPCPQASRITGSSCLVPSSGHGELWAGLMVTVSGPLHSLIPGAQQPQDGLGGHTFSLLPLSVASAQDEGAAATLKGDVLPGRGIHVTCYVSLCDSPPCLCRSLRAWAWGRQDMALHVPLLGSGRAWPGGSPGFSSHPNRITAHSQEVSRSWPHVAESMGDYSPPKPTASLAQKAKGLLER